MNAPDHAITAYRPLALDDLAPSGTHIQALRRARFSQPALEELAANIGAHGVLQPVLVRPLNDPACPAGFEIVAGERRWLAAKIAGLEKIPAIVREIADADLVELQLTENLQREDLHPMEEAEGYAELMHQGNASADDVAGLVHKSRSHVYDRLRLLKLQPDAREAFYAGKLDVSRALELARIADADKQARILKLALEENWRHDGPALSVRALREEIAKKKLTLPLADAPFALDDATLLRFLKRKKGVEDCDGLPACVGCPNFAGAGTEADPDVCTEVACYEDKVKDLQRRRRATAEMNGRAIVAGEAAAEILPRKGYVVGHVDLDAPCDDVEFPEPRPEAANDDEYDSPEFQAKLDAYDEREEAWRPPTYRELLGEAAAGAVLVEDPRGKALRELLPLAEAKKALKDKGITLPSHIGAKLPKPYDYKAEQEKYERQREAQRAREETERAWRTKVLQEIHAKFKGPLTQADLADVADALLDGWTEKEGMKRAFGKLPQPHSMKVAELPRLICELLAAGAVGAAHVGPQALLALAKRCKVDVAKIKKACADEARAKTKGEPAAKAKPAKKKGAKK